MLHTGKRLLRFALDFHSHPPTAYKHVLQRANNYQTTPTYSLDAPNAQVLCSSCKQVPRTPVGRDYELDRTLLRGIGKAEPHGVRALHAARKSMLLANRQLLCQK